MTTESNLDAGAALREIRKLLGCNAREMSERFGMRGSHYQVWETTGPAASPTLTAIIRQAYRLGRPDLAQPLLDFIGQRVGLRLDGETMEFQIR